ncbi:hypothetical protein PNEG_01498 [Pneumocystis murina B123]|uniref:Matrin-type domain-containing protein n=1 Tax=Pneumocystis murina (strain B123) TaxID=1069680 RepID=M7NSZ6_PNEMU|nr:hypothetical protein PNEG_01498 [Pneumocystis murina B123]EMR10226.1 hypothetical protein PNEG_01498 [Pneumocystis murina B123]
MESLLERQRALHEDIERLEQAIADRLAQDNKKIKDRLSQEHDVAKFLDRIAEQSKKLLDIYTNEDKTQLLNETLTTSGSEFEEFYRQLREIKDFHRRYPNEKVENFEELYKKSPEEDEISKIFSGEENYGRFFDLNVLHEQWLNLKGVKYISYTKYLDFYDKFSSIHPRIKNENYFKYLVNLESYLESFYKRINPLEDHNKIISGIEADFEKEWNSGKLLELIVPMVNTGLISEDIFCDACNKNYSKKTVYDAHLTSKKHKKAEQAKKNKDKNDEKINNDTNEHHPLPKIDLLKKRILVKKEYFIQRLSSLLNSEREATKRNVVRKQTLTDRERQAELEAAENEETIIEEIKEDDRIWNPLKLPLGWDGKPIPYWLWKLHGLGVEYPCEICGNFIYMGRKAFDKHFMEWRHVHGLRCLGIQNSILFKEITGIEDALALWEKLKSDKKNSDRLLESTIEMEDDQGNVMSEKVYNDLKNQGLL